MPGIFPLKPEIDYTPNERSYVNMAGEVASTMLPTLASTTARQMFIELHEGPGTAAELADRLDTTIQNVLHHLTSLEEAGLIKVVDIWYSSRGTEMKVYAPIAQSLVFFSGTKEDFDLIKQATQEQGGDVNS